MPMSTSPAIFEKGPQGSGPNKWEKLCEAGRSAEEFTTYALVLGVVAVGGALDNVKNAITAAVKNRQEARTNRSEEIQHAFHHGGLIEATERWGARAVKQFVAEHARRVAAEEAAAKAADADNHPYE